MENIYFILILLFFMILIGGLILRGHHLKKWFLAWRGNGQILQEDVLKQIAIAEASQKLLNVQDLSGVLNQSEAQVQSCLERLVLSGDLSRDGAYYRLTTTGRETAVNILRAHRLWERFLADETGFPEGEWHARAERLEHKITTPEIDDLSSQLGNPAFDPHGDPIPTARGEIPPEIGRPLNRFLPGYAGRIIHLEDEPEAIYHQILDHNLALGLEVYILESSPERFVIWLDGDEIALKPEEAANVFLVPINDWDISEHMPGVRLSSLKPGEVGTVSQISPILRGQERRRLMDLGLIPGTHIQTEFQGPSGEPVAYQIRGAIIALRKEQTDHIRIHTGQEKPI